RDAHRRWPARGEELAAARLSGRRRQDLPDTRLRGCRDSRRRGEIRLMAGWIGMTEFQAYLIGAGLLANPVPENDRAAFLPLSEALSAAQNEFEQRTGWLPFVWNGEVETRDFDVDGRTTFDLQGGLLRLESVTIGASDYSQEVFPGPPNALARGLCFSYLEMR